MDIGLSSKGQLLIVVYTERQSNIRIISSRKATNAERKIYEQY
ncbi:MAG: BrnT family toxin [Dolichospermum sp.]